MDRLHRFTFYVDLKKMTEPLIFQIMPVNERDADPSEYDLNRFFRSFEQEMNMVAHQAVSIDIPNLNIMPMASIPMGSAARLRSAGEIG